MFLNVRFLLSMSQICAAVSALRNVRSLSWPANKKMTKPKVPDILDWLQAMFGFQVFLFPRIAHVSKLLLLFNACFLKITFCLIFGWELKCFGYMQKDNVANQREHLILLLANMHVRLDPKPTLKRKVNVKTHGSAKLDDLHGSR